MGEWGNVRSECFDRCNLRSEWGNVRSECFDMCNLMLRINIGMLMLGMIGS